MIDRLNQTLKARLPWLHRAIRALVRSLLGGGTQGRAFPRRLAGRWVWVHSRFVGSSLEVEPPVQRRLAQALHPGDVFFDVGAHVGWHSLAAAGRVGPTGSVFAFEPSPANLAVLAFHQSRNRLAQMTVVDRAVAAKDDELVTFHLLNAGDSSSNSLTFADLGPGRAPIASTPLPVRTVTLDSFARARNLKPALIKIDVEGAEYDVLVGAQSLLRSAKPRLILALHPNWLPRGITPDHIATLLADAGYRITTLAGSPVQDWELAEYWCEPPV